MTAPFVSLTATGLRLRVRLQPRATHTRIVGPHGDALKVQVTAPPVEGAANEALERLIATVGRIPRNAVHVVAGTKSRDKVVEVICPDPDEVTLRLSGQ